MTDEADDDTAMMDQFIEKITPKLTETIMQKVTADVEGQITGIKAKNAELLLKLSEQKTHSEDLAAQLAATPAQQPNDNAPVQITKADARNVAAYRKARAQAEAKGVQLQIVSDE